MKKVLFFIAATILLAACTETKEVKAEKLAKQTLNGFIVNMDTYEPIETRVDSAFAPLTSLEVFEYIAQLPQQLKKYESWQHKVDNAKTTLRAYANPRYPYERYSYNDAKENYDKYSKYMAEFEEKMKDFNNDLEEKSKEEPVFCGYLVRHKYRFVSKEGEKTIGQHLFFMNEDLTKVESMIDMNDEYIKSMMEEADMINFGNK